LIVTNSRSRPIFLLWSLLGLVLSIWGFFHPQIANGFTKLFGDNLDGMIEAFLLGHWYRVARGLQAWNDAGYFAPIHDTLGYNDGLFLYGLISLPFRYAGLDLLRTQESVHLIVKTIGFVSMVALLDRVVAKRSLACIVGAAVFTLMISSSNQAGHGQLLSVGFAPLAMLLLLNTLDHIGRSGRGLLSWGAAFVVLMGAWLITSFYMAWFFILLCGASALIAAALDFATLSARLGAWRQIRMRPLLPLLVVGMLSLVPFLLVYGPKLRETKGHQYAAALAYTVRLHDMANIGCCSFVWGPAFHSIDSMVPGWFRGGEFAVGFTPDILACMAATALLVLWTRKIRLRRTEAALIGGGLLLLLAPISLAGHSPWWLIYKFVPGATGVRVVARLWIMLALPVGVMVAMLVHRLSHAGHRFAALALSALLIASEVPTATVIGLDVATEERKADAVPKPPADCNSFFVASHIRPDQSQDLIYSLYHYNVLAMQISDHVDLPTLNGFASFLPPDWNFAAAPQDTYLSRVAAYAGAHQMKAVCSYDVENAVWNDTPFKAP
jgi:hypothetical protein